MQAIFEKGILGDYSVYPSTGNPYEAQIMIPLVTSLAIGSLIGIFEVSYVNKWFQNSSFVKKIIFKTIVYTVAIIMATLIIIVSGHCISQGLSPLSEKVWKFVYSFFSNFAFWSIICFYSLAIIISLFYKEVSDNLGQAVFFNFFTGRYHQPKVENRVFMFLDMNSSTAHAEKLGHIRYFQMLKDFYADLSEPILTYGGEIYQYVGDEIVITWRVKKKFANNALDCFFAMKSTLTQKHAKYLSKYAIAPTFKAGIHYGKVTTGEIGSIKKDIAFSGDTLNTTSRIQSLCNKFGVDLLASEKFITALKLKDVYDISAMGNVELRGRNQKIKISAVTKPVLNKGTQ